MISREELAARSREMTLERLDWAIHLSGEIHALQKTLLAAAEGSKDGIAQLLRAFHIADAKQTERFQRLEGMLGEKHMDVKKRRCDLNVETESAVAVAKGLESAVQVLNRTHGQQFERLEKLQLEMRHEVQATFMKWFVRVEAIEQALERNRKEQFERLQRLQLDIQCDVQAKVAQQAVDNTIVSLQLNTADHGEPQGTTANDGEPRKTKASHSETLRTTANHSEPQRDKSCFGDIGMESCHSSTAVAIKQQACDLTSLGKQTLLKDPVVNPVRHEQLLSWSENVAEEFNSMQFLVELVGQAIWHVLGVLSIPLLLLLYGRSMHALCNRGMWVRCSRDKGFPFAVFGSQVLFSALTMVPVIIIIGFQPEHTSLTDVVVVVMFVVLKCLTIAIKYAFMPRAVWNQMNVVAWDTSRLKGTLLLDAWLSVSEETAEMQVDWALLTTVGLAEEEPYLTFLQPTTTDSARAIQALQGKTTRRLVAEILVQEDTSRLPHGLTLENDMAPPFEEACWPARMAAGTVTMPLRAFFSHLIQVILQAEKKSPVGVHGMKVIVVVSLVVTFTPCFGRLLEGRPFMGNNMLAILSISMYLFPLFFTCFLNFLYLYVAIRDMWRRRALMQCCTALLSMMPEDRKLVPWQVKTLGVLDTRNVKTMEAFLHLRDLCKDWGIFYSLRCTSFVNAYTVVTACLVACILVCIQFQLYEFITKSILLAALVNPAFLLLSIVQLAVIGEGVNSTAARLSMLLQRHASAISESALGLHLNNAETPEDCRLRQALKGVKSAQTSIALDQDSVKLLGQRCGIGILTALYAVPVYLVLRLRDMCMEQPKLCTF